MNHQIRLVPETVTSLSNLHDCCYQFQTRNIYFTECICYKCLRIRDVVDVPYKSCESSDDDCVQKNVFGSCLMRHALRGARVETSLDAYLSKYPSNGAIGIPHKFINIFLLYFPCKNISSLLPIQTYFLGDVEYFPHPSRIFSPLMNRRRRDLLRRNGKGIDRYYGKISWSSVRKACCNE